MTVLKLFLLFFAGIVLSVVVPIGAKCVVKEARDTPAKGGTWDRVMAYARPVLRMSVGSAILGIQLVIIFLEGGAKAEEVASFNAILHGYGWDATLQKIRESQ
jgi:hypothetical protein